MAIWQESFEHAQLSDVGMRRRNNQDSLGMVLAADENIWHARGHVLMVADGMGAHAAGELASKIAVDTVPHLYLKLRDLPPGEALERAIIEANSEVHRRGQANPEFHNMGTTSSVLAILPDAAWIAHIGDSRVYRLRGDCLEQLTFDHSLVWEARRDNNWPAGIDPTHALPRNVITRSLGPNAQIVVDVEGPFPVEPGDTFLLCSDGLTGALTDEELAPILAHLPAEEAAAVLVDLANLRGGPDNITVLVGRVLPAWRQKAGATPEAARRVTPPRADVHPAVWVGAGVCFLAAVGLLIARQPWLAGIGAVLGTLVAGLGWAFRGGGARTNDKAGAPNRTSKAPYTRTSCSNATQFLQKLSTLTAELRSAAVEASLDVGALDQACRQAAEAGRTGQTAQALRLYARSISSVMNEFRRRKHEANDSVVDL
ncbi:MAG: protein phosphatase 2C domain-containing protein [Pirellulales bacterium]